MKTFISDDLEHDNIVFELQRELVKILKGLLTTDFDGMPTESVRFNDYVAYDEKWWIGVVEEVDRVEQDVKINFPHPSGPARIFVGPENLMSAW